MNRSKFTKNLCKLVTIQSASYQTKVMMRYIKGVVQSIGGCTMSFDDYGNMYVTKGSGPYPAMVCHTDTVHDIVKEPIASAVIKGNIVAFKTISMEQVGTGGDDKVGIHITLELLKERENMKAVFFLDEEVGCIGSSSCDFKFFDDCLFVLECDRRGDTDFVNSISGTELYGNDFAEAIKVILQKHNRTTCSGGMTDVLEIAYETDLPVANMSCGYYKPHSDEEYININDVISTYELCLDIFKYINIKHSYNKKRTSYFKGYNYGNYNNWGHGYDMYYDNYEDVYDLTSDELEESVKKTCGPKCEMRNGFCDSCMMHVDEMYEFYNDDKNEIKSTPMETPVQTFRLPSKSSD
tara:strand:+ start:1721 stop:2776 length:1056 start_codon:yes stop_codon:yes gene_type:complete